MYSINYGTYYLLPGLSFNTDHDKHYLLCLYSYAIIYLVFHPSGYCCGYQYYIIIHDYLTLSESNCNILKAPKSPSKLVSQSLEEILLCDIQSLQDEVNHAALGYSSLIITYREIRNCACDIIKSVYHAACDAIHAQIE